MASKNHNMSHFLPHTILQNGIFNGMTGNNISIYPFAFQEADILYETMDKIVKFISDPVVSDYLIEKEMHSITGEYYLDLADGNFIIYNIFLIKEVKKFNLYTNY
jgi:secreted Zn-dependent insulinase-like peptidase